jgi:hypothetical protein
MMVGRKVLKEDTKNIRLGGKGGGGKEAGPFYNMLPLRLICRHILRNLHFQLTVILYGKGRTGGRF